MPILPSLIFLGLLPCALYAWAWVSYDYLTRASEDAPKLILWVLGLLILPAAPLVLVGFLDLSALHFLPVIPTMAILSTGICLICFLIIQFVPKTAEGIRVRNSVSATSLYLFLIWLFVLTNLH